LQSEIWAKNQAIEGVKMKNSSLKTGKFNAESVAELMVQKMHSFFSKILIKFPSLYSIAYRLPFSPFRGIMWRFFCDKSVYAVLDVGVFRGAVGRLVRLLEKRRHFIVGIDRHRPYLMSCKQTGIYNELLLADGRYLPFRNGVFDTVVAVEVIEHFPKEDGLRFLEALESLVKYQVIFTTPVGFMEIYNLDSEFQRHLSGWVPEEFRSLGWKIRGTYGVRLLPQKLAYYLSFLVPLSYFVPKCAYNMMCVKRCSFSFLVSYWMTY
jgi:SAM-dependent methyltransferase